MDHFYTVKEVAELLRISTATVRKLIKDGEIPMLMFGAQWRIPKKAFNQYASQGSDSRVKNG
jgi:excisionase family DNA binding protein